MAYEIVVIGASWGGASALSRILRDLPDSFPACVLLVQHRRNTPETLLADLLQEQTRLRVSEPADGELLRHGEVFVAPANAHLLVEGGHVRLGDEPAVQHSRPSIDVTLGSVAKAYGSRSVGVVLTGANVDGALGLRELVDSGGYGIVQEPDSAEMPVMPLAARNLVPEAAVVPLEQIASHLAGLVDRGG
jgi:two-component system chemotaxis response regulator CheB